MSLVILFFSLKLIFIFGEFSFIVAHARHFGSNEEYTPQGKNQASNIALKPQTFNLKQPISPIAI